MDVAAGVRVGNGIVAAMHDVKFRAAGIRVAGIVDTDPEKRARAVQSGAMAFRTCAEAAAIQPLLWDVCVDTEHHLEVISDILAVDPTAHVLVEKPICRFSDIQRLRRTLDRVRATLIVNENYHSSAVTAAVKTIAFEKLGIRPRRVAVEMTKNRLRDFARGRFMDCELAALGYEGSHMIAILLDLGKEYAPENIAHATFEDAIIAGRHGCEVLADQGSASVQYITPSGINVELYTSLTGGVKYRYWPFEGTAPYAITESDPTRHRVLVVEGTNQQGLTYTVVGFYEPMRRFARCEGAVAILKSNHLIDLIAPIHDDTLGNHLSRALQCFRGQGDNPGDPETAIGIVEALHRARLHAHKLRGAAAID